jgi:hypothetical protein
MVTFSFHRFSQWSLLSDARFYVFTSPSLCIFPYILFMALLNQSLHVAKGISDTKTMSARAHFFPIKLSFPFGMIDNLNLK